MTKHLAVGLAQFAPEASIRGNVGDEDVEIDKVLPGGTGALEGRSNVSTRLRELFEKILADGAVGPVPGLSGEEDDSTCFDHRRVREADRLGQLRRVDEEVAHRPTGRSTRAAARS